MRTGVAAVLFVFSLLVVFSSTCAFGAGEQTNEHAAARELAEQVMQWIKEDDIPGMFVALKGRFAWTESNLRTVEPHLASQIAQHALLYGDSLHDIEFLGTESLGRSFVRFNYLAKRERHAVAWRATLYRPTDKWLISEVTYNATIEALLKPAP